MKLSNFKYIKTTNPGSSKETYFAEVDVSTGFFAWKKTERKVIFRELASFWTFMDTGKFTPGSQAEELDRRSKALRGYMNGRVSG